jgi:hypothetical protein
MSSQLSRGQRQNQALDQRKEQRERMLKRVDRLVRGMEAVAQRLSSDKVSTSQRSVLVSRFNDLQRRVNKIDGIVGSEGRGDGIANAPGVHIGLEVEGREDARAEKRQSKEQQAATRTAPTQPNSEERGNLVDLQA